MFLNFIQYILKEHIPNFTHKKHTRKNGILSRAKKVLPLSPQLLFSFTYFSIFFFVATKITLFRQFFFRYFPHAVLYIKKITPKNIFPNISFHQEKKKHQVSPSEKHRRYVKQYFILQTK